MRSTLTARTVRSSGWPMGVPTIHSVPVLGPLLAHALPASKGRALQYNCLRRSMTLRMKQCPEAVLAAGAGKGKCGVGSNYRNEQATACDHLQQ